MKTTVTRAALALALGLGALGAQGDDAMAQTPEPTFEVDRKSRARGPIKSFFRYMKQAARDKRAPEEALERAARELDKAAERDPELDLTPLRGYHAARSKELLAAAADADAARALERRYGALVDRIASTTINTTWVGEADSARVDAAVAEYRGWVDEVGAAEFDAVSPEARQRARQRIALSMDAVVRALPRDLEFAKAGPAAYNTLVTYDTYLYAARAFFPDEPRYAEAARTVSARLSALGSRAGADAARAQDEAARAAEVRMPPATHTDPAAEALFRQAFATGGFGEVPLAIRITSDWTVERDPVSGAIVGRRRDAAIAARHAQGHCNLYDFTMFQGHDGKSWGAARRSSHSTRRIACKNLD